MRYIPLLGFFILLPTHSFAATNNWIATSAGTWGTAANWSTGAVPVSTDDVMFTSSHVANCTIGTAINQVNSITIASGYTGVIDNTSASTITILGTAGFNQSGGSFYMADGQTTTMTTTSLTVSGGVFCLTGSGATCATGGVTATLNVSGNFSVTSGVFDRAGGAATTINFNGASQQTYTGNSGMFANQMIVNFNVLTNATVKLVGNGSLGKSTGTFTVGQTATLDTTIVPLTGSNPNFTLSLVGTLVIGDPNGITSAAATGSIQTTGTRNFNVGANYTYGGGVAQVAGNQLPSTVNNLSVINSGTMLTLPTLTATNAILISGGTLNQNCSGTLTTGSISIVSGGTYIACNSTGAAGAANIMLVNGTGAISIDSTSSFDYVGTGTITTGPGNVVNNGKLRIWGSTATNPPTCGATTATVTKSGSPSTWSGSGSFILADVNVTNQPSTPHLTCYNCTGSSTNWSTTSSCSGAPTLISLGAFTATQQDGGVLLKWRTGYEVSNLGFQVYRQDGARTTRLTPSPIAGSALLAGPATVLTAGNSYTWFDPEGAPTSIYSIEELSLAGTKTMHPSVHVSHSRAAQSPTSRLLLSQLGRASSSKTAPLEARAPSPRTSPSQIASQNRLTASPSLKLAIQHEGWYRVEAAQLTAAGLPSGTNPQLLQLFVNGGELPILVEGENHGAIEAIEFYGAGLDTIWSDTQIYWLTWGSSVGKRAQSLPAANPPTAQQPQPTTRLTIEWRSRTLYFAALLNGDADNFFGPVLDAADPLTQPLTITNLDTAAQDVSRLTVKLQGATAGPHNVAVALNGAPLGALLFADQNAGESAFSVGASQLHEGANTLTLTVQGAAGDVSLFDTVQVSYPHLYAADADYLRFTAPAGSSITVGGFTSPRIQVVDITDQSSIALPQVAVTSQGTSYAATFTPPGAGTRTLLAFTTARKSAPSSIASNHPSSWRAAQPGSDMIVLSHADFLPSLTPLKSLRESQGHTVTLIDVQELYDDFNFGAMSPYAIKEFLSSAKSGWQTKPRWLLLVGDATLDPRNYLGTGLVDYLPSELVDTAMIETASDDWYADFNGDGIPQLAIGRLPVRTAAEAASLAARIVAYDRSSAAAWRNQTLLVVGQSDSDNDFSGAAQKVQASLPRSMAVAQVQDGDSNARANLLKALNAGVALVNYTGHGSSEVWADGLFSSTDAAALTNGAALPFVVSMTCLNGYFEDVYTESLAKALMKAPGGGAIAVWASSGLTSSPAQSTLNTALLSALFGASPLTLGEAAAAAKAATADIDIRRTWILFGDPATRLQ